MKLRGKSGLRKHSLFVESKEDAAPLPGAASSFDENIWLDGGKKYRFMAVVLSFE